MAEAKPRRTTMTSDVAKLRALAAAGVSMKEAARRTGITYGTVQRLSGQFNLPFRRGAAYQPEDPAVADLARARLEATMKLLKRAPAAR